MNKNTNIVEVHRGNQVESAHHVHIAVVDATGKLRHHLGHVEQNIYARSSMKPIQAIPLIATGAADYYDFSDADVSLCTASHSGEDMHTERVLSILNRLGLDSSDLQCGTHPPRWEETYKRLIRQHQEVTPLYNNCSGKHTGMLATATFMNEPIETYYRLDHPVQQRILEAVSYVCDYPKNDIAIGTDGCGVPVHGLPLEKLAYGFARMAQRETLDEAYGNHARRITKAMRTAPEMVGGTDRFCSDFMSVGKGRFFGKAGAEGVYCIGDTETGLGIAIKVADGNGRAVYPAAVETLTQLGLLTDHQIEQLKEYHHPKVKNARKEVIGELVPAFRLNQVALA